MEKLIIVKNITKTFPGVKALDNVSIDVNRGEVLSLMGENGAGKSTLIKVLAGVYDMDDGEIYIEGQKVDIKSPVDSQNLGISIIYQELNLLPNMSIAENIFLAREKRQGGLFYDKKKTVEEATKLMNEVGLYCNPNKLVEELSVSQRQMVEVAKALSVNSKLIIMDEPTSSLTDRETETLFGVIDKLKRNNVSVIFVSHKLREVQKISDRVYILRDGANSGVINKGEITEDRIIQMMVGRKLENLFDKENVEITDVVLKVRNLSTKNFLKNINFDVRKGEIIGFAGLVGAGRTEVMRAVFGFDKIKTGEIYIEGNKVEIKSPKDAINYGLALVPEDRKEQGLVMEMSVRENTTLANLKQVSKLGFINIGEENKITDSYINKIRTKTPSREQKVVNLSGGNQQKVVLSKWLMTNPKILILDEPTRGIDVGAKKEIYTIMSNLAKRGVAIIMISSELPEILGMSDRIIVMHEGEIKGVLNREESSQEKILEIALTKNDKFGGEGNDKIYRRK